MSIGIPIKLLHEAEGHIITIETISGEVYRGNLVEAEDNMNVHLTTVQLTRRDGSVTSLEQAFLRGSKIRFFIVPDMLKHAPFFKNLDQLKTAAGQRGPENNRGGGRGGGFRGRGRGMKCEMLFC